jgi:hypothetical protein
LTLPGGFVETQILSFELQFSMEKKDDLYLPPYKGSLVFHYAKIADDAAEEAAQ